MDKTLKTNEAAYPIISIGFPFRSELPNQKLTPNSASDKRKHINASFFIIIQSAFSFFL